MKTNIRASSLPLLASTFWVALGLVSTPAKAELADGLVEFWPFDGDYSAGVTVDHAGTLQAKGSGLIESGFVPGKFGQCIDLESSDANNQAAVVIGGDENDFDFTGGSMSVSAWYTTESLYVAWQTLVGKGENSNWRLARNNASGNSLKLYLTIIGDAKLNLQDDSWHHVVATVDAVNGNRLYVDGTQVASNAGPSNLTGNATPMQIGGNPQAANRGWDGKIDDVGVWNRVLTVEEVAALWNDGVGASIGNLIGFGAPPFAITEFAYSPVDDRITLTWNSQANATYTVRYSTDISNWGADLSDGIGAADDEVADDGDLITKSFDLGAFGLADAEMLYFRVERN